MSLKNEYARQALLSLKIFLAARRDGADVPPAVRRIAADASDILKPFLERAESETADVFGDGSFPAKFFSDLLRGFINAEQERRRTAGEDMNRFKDAVALLESFHVLSRQLIPEIAAQKEDDKAAS